MKIQLKNERNHLYSALEQVMINRGINKNDIRDYLFTTDKCVSSFSAFGSVMDKAVERMARALEQGEKVLVIVDSDCDGFTSSALLINYFLELAPKWAGENIDYFIHSGKQHGLSDVNINEVAGKYTLVITPDGSSEDYDYHLAFAEKGIDILVLDHHDAKIQSPNAIVVNNQLSDYPNKQLSGVGVTWQFCRALDVHYGVQYSEHYLDLVALGNCGDMMSMTSVETKHLITEGFKEESLHNPLVYGIRQKNSYSIGAKLTPHGAAWYIVPFINAMVRSGTEEEKDIVFQSMLFNKAFKVVPSTKRGHKLGETERILDQALRIISNVKNRQTKDQNDALEYLEEKIVQGNLLQHKVLLIMLEKSSISKNLAGLIANKLAPKYQRPCCILMKQQKEEIVCPTVDCAPDFVSVVTYEGSARGYEKTGIKDFKEICNNSGVVEYAQGHANAFGLGIREENVGAFLQYIDERFKDISNEPIYLVDFDGKYITYNDVYSVCANVEDCIGKDFDEPLVGFSGFCIKPEKVTIYTTEKGNTVKIALSDNVSLMFFRADTEFCNMIQQRGYSTYIDAVGTMSLNTFNGKTTGQIIVKDYEIISHVHDWDF